MRQRTERDFEKLALLVQMWQQGHNHFEAMRGAVARNIYLTVDQQKHQVELLQELELECKRDRAGIDV